MSAVPASGAPAEPESRISTGERRFAEAARRLSGMTGLVFGWPPDAFWRATPAELEALLEAATGDGDEIDPPDRQAVARLMEAFPDG